MNDQGIRLYYDIKGSGPALFFLHGWPHNHTVWTKETTYLSKKGYKTIAMDLRGNGLSTKPNDYDQYSFEHFTNDILLIVRKERIRNFALIGHSFGGMIAIASYKKLKSYLTALILVDTTYENPLKHIPYLKRIKITPFAKKALDYLVAHTKIQKKYFPSYNFSKMKKHSDFFYWMKGLKETPVKSILAVLEEMLNLEKEKVLKKITVPTLIIEGSKDIKTPVKQAKHMNKMIRNSELVVIPKATHDTNIQNPKIIQNEIYNFLKQRN